MALVPLFQNPAGADDHGKTWKFDYNTGTARMASADSRILISDHGASPSALAAVNVAAIQDALDEGSALGRSVLFEDGEYDLGAGQIQILCSVESSPNCVLLSQRTSGAAVIVGDHTDDDSAAVLAGLSIALPKVRRSTAQWSAAATSGTDAGVEFRSVISSEIWIPEVTNWTLGVHVDPTGSAPWVAFAYNVIHVGYLRNNCRNFVVEPKGTGGYANENYVIGGRMSQEIAGTNVAGTRQIQMLKTGSNVVSGWQWFGASVEGNVPEYVIDCYGYGCQFIGLRFEGTTPTVRWGNGSQYNRIIGGVNSSQLTFVVGTSTYGNSLLAEDGAEIVDMNTAAGHVLHSQWGNARPVITVLDYAANPWAGGDHASDYAWSWTPLALLGKRSGDAYPRFKLNAYDGYLELSDGTTTPAIAFGPWSADRIFMGAHVNFYTHNTYDLGDTNYRPRYVRAGTAVVTAAVATGSRPSAATAGVGAMVYDTTLSKPIWSDGTVWKDATGATV